MRAGLALFLLIAPIPAARALEAVIQGKSVSLPIPVGFCELSDSDRSDSRLTNLILNPQESWRLSISADCAQLPDWRTGKRQWLYGFAHYINSGPVTGTVQDVCRAVSSMTPPRNKIVPDHASSIKPAAEATLQLLKELERSSDVPIGVAAEDPDICYVAWPLKADTDTFYFDMAAHTSVKNRRLQYHRLRRYTGPDSVIDGLAKLKEDVATLHAANR
jgi:hypothetical protein